MAQAPAPKNETFHAPICIESARKQVLFRAQNSVYFFVSAPGATLRIALFDPDSERWIFPKEIRYNYATFFQRNEVAVGKKYALILTEDQKGVALVAKETGAIVRRFFDHHAPGRDIVSQLVLKEEAAESGVLFVTEKNWVAYYSLEGGFKFTLPLKDDPYFIDVCKEGLVTLTTSTVLKFYNLRTSRVIAKVALGSLPLIYSFHPGTSLLFASTSKEPNKLGAWQLEGGWQGDLDVTIRGPIMGFSLVGNELFVLGTNAIACYNAIKNTVEKEMIKNFEAGRTFLFGKEVFIFSE